MQKKEAAFTTRFLLWARGNILAPAVFEIKSTRGKDTFYIREFKEHQRNALLAATEGIFTYKISDSALGYKPFDAILFGKMRGYLVLAYPQRFYVIAVRQVPLSGTLSETEACLLSAYKG